MKLQKGIIRQTDKCITIWSYESFFNEKEKITRYLLVLFSDEFIKDLEEMIKLNKREELFDILNDEISYDNGTIYTS